MTRAKKNAFLNAAEAERVASHLALRAKDWLQDFESPRAVLFVEGETERLVLRKHSTLEQAGVCLLDFGTVGIEPLIRVADARSIPWHVLVDHDEAGTHYANRAREHLHRRQPSMHITIADAASFELALWNEGFREDLRAIALEQDVALVDDTLESLLRAARLKLPKPMLVERAIARAQARDASIELPRSMRAAIAAVLAQVSSAREI
ncbi:MAG: ATP-dependent endonuclease [Phycisphaerales bacterium]|nr:ATP-dependent endonuclease [Phycisphaerales bacterium]